ncbi:MAG: LysR family transcriptional regulator [Lachnospiraceae bacterium]|nr:LysR family transcriptional regulator [Lachnospiraceae bacterium]
MELRQIQYFIQLYKDCNITKSSQALFISQQGLSKSIGRLEEELGFLLFERTASGVIPTDYANKLYLHFRKVLDAFHELELEIEHIREERILKISAHPGFALSTDKDKFAEYSRYYPEYKTKYIEEPKEKAMQHLLEHKADVAYMLAPIPEGFQSHQLIGKSPLYAVMEKKHPLAKKEHINIWDLKNQTLLLLDIYAEYSQLILNQTETKDIPYVIHDKVTMNEFLSIISSSLFIGFSTDIIYRYYDFPNISFIPFILPDGSSLYSETHLVTPKNVFLDWEMQHYINYAKEKYHDTLNDDAT